MSPKSSYPKPRSQTLFKSKTLIHPRPLPLSSLNLTLQPLPTSVRNLPSDLRRPIRRNQNNASSKRARDRQKQHHVEMEVLVQGNDHTIGLLESRVSGLENKLAALTEHKNVRRRDKHVLEGRGEFFEQREFFGDPF